MKGEKVMNKEREWKMDKISKSERRRKEGREAGR